MKVELAAPPVGVHRAEYSLTWHDWAMPLRIVFAQSFIPGDAATFELDERWLHRRYLVLHVLCVRAEIVIMGPLWPEEEEEV